MDPNGQWKDFIAEFQTYTEGVFSPDIFRVWSAISLVAGALERRVWIKLGTNLTYPNLYTFLVSPPGVGKYIVELVRDFWTSTKEPNSTKGAFQVAPDSMTKASLIDTLNAASRLFLPPQGSAITYHSLLIAAEEGSVFLPNYDLEFIGVLNSIYNNKDWHKEVRRTGSVKTVDIERPQLNIVAGVQPGWLGSVFPEEAWTTGLTSRIIMVYASESPLKELFAEDNAQDELKSSLLHKLSQMSALYGQFKWEKPAADLAAKWHREGGPPAPRHSKLANYTRRRTTLHMPKLAMVSAVANSGKLIITEEDVRRAIAWLCEAEGTMPDVFRAMVGKSDFQIIEEIHYFVLQQWARNKQKSVPEHLIIKFISQRVPSDKIKPILEAAERSNAIERIAGTTEYKPKPKYTHGVE